MDGDDGQRTNHIVRLHHGLAMGDRDVECKLGAVVFAVSDGERLSARYRDLIRELLAMGERDVERKLIAMVDSHQVRDLVAEPDSHVERKLVAVVHRNDHRKLIEMANLDADR